MVLQSVFFYQEEVFCHYLHLQSSFFYLTFLMSGKWKHITINKIESSCDLSLWAFLTDKLASYLSKLQISREIMTEVNNNIHYNSDGMGGHDEIIPAPWIATQVGKMEPSCPLWTTHYVPQETFLRKP